MYSASMSVYAYTECRLEQALDQRFAVKAFLSVHCTIFYLSLLRTQSLSFSLPLYAVWIKSTRVMCLIYLFIYSLLFIWHHLFTFFIYYQNTEIIMCFCRCFASFSPSLSLSLPVSVFNLKPAITRELRNTYRINFFCIFDSKRKRRGIKLRLL